MAAKRRPQRPGRGSFTVGTVPWLDPGPLVSPAPPLASPAPHVSPGRAVFPGCGRLPDSSPRPAPAPPPSSSPPPGRARPQSHTELCQDLFRLVLDLPPGDADHGEALGGEDAVASAVVLEGAALGVVGEPVDLETAHHGVEAWPRHAGLPQQRQEPGLRLRAGEGGSGGVVEERAERAAAPAVGVAGSMASSASYATMSRFRPRARARSSW